MYLLEIKTLNKQFLLQPGSILGRPATYLSVANNVSIALEEAQTIAIVGESGSGKSTLGRMVSMLETPDSGEIIFDGQDITKLNYQQQRIVRKQIGLVFQDPYSALNPRMPILSSLIEPMVVNGVGSHQQRKQRAMEVLDWVGMPHDTLVKYPHEFSGGQRQRIAIARALMLNPKLIIADEPLSALDVSIQSQILNLFKDLQQNHGIAFFFISHDMAVVYHLANHVAVMKTGNIVEYTDKVSFFSNPQHPYSRELLQAVPDINRQRRRKNRVTDNRISEVINS